MNSDRSRFQVFIEGKIGCLDPVHIKEYKGVLKELNLNPTHSNEAQGLIDDDCLDLYYKSCLSLAEALESISLGAQSWAIVKLYYSVYYSLKAELGLIGFGLIKCAGIYSIDVRRRLEPKKWSGRGDHITTTNVFKGLREGQDLLLTNRINEVAVYDWLRDKRERVQYRDRTFFEPDLSYFSKHFSDAQKFRERISLYLGDTDGVYCFQDDHALLAAPLVRFKKLKTVLVGRELPDPLLGRSDHIENCVENFSRPNDSIRKLLLSHE